MKVKEIEELIDFINKSGLDEVNIETEHIKLRIKRNSYILPQADNSIASTKTPIVQTVPAAQLSNEYVESEHYVTIKSPMIGTFYRAANSEATPFVQEGHTIRPEQVVCIIEAMKLFNEIEAEIAGTIVKVLVEDASPVEYDQPLFLVQPDG